MVMELKLVPLRLLLFVRFAAPLGKTRFSPPFPVGAAPPSQLPLVFQFGLLAPVQVNVCAAPCGASVSRASNTSRAAMRSRRTPRGGGRAEAGLLGTGWDFGVASHFEQSTLVVGGAIRSLKRPGGGRRAVPSQGAYPSWGRRYLHLSQRLR